MVVLVFVDENPEKLVQRRSFAVHGRAQVIVPIDDFTVQLRTQAFLLDVPHADSFQVGANAQAAHIELKVRAYPNFQPGFLINPKIAHLDSAAWVSQQFAGGRVLQQGFLNVQRGAELLAGDQHFPFGVLPPRIQQFVGEYHCRVD
ncbi:Uncharacterised protein [Salmonella enterica subsp. enterica serovar Typhimurium str. DT104]|nr:Uncharacterised protein [Salmonella enterica subsp. enterica serovar Typhimurium str. DT104]CQN08000.1 Uncharacterised protein [Salmonella enterica subsp. enterica serovar Typhimurium str. DT104]